MHLVVDVRLCSMRCIAQHWITAAVATKHSLQPLYLLHKGLIAGGQVTDHVCLVRSSQAGKHRGDERCAARPTNIAREIREAGDVVALGLLYPDVGDHVDRNEQKGKT